MKRATALAALVTLLAAAPLDAQLEEMRQTIFGMD